MGHILVVDDEPAIVAVVRERLEREGFHVRAVASGEEALASLEADPADLVVLDVMLPGMDGLEVLRRLREWSQVYVLLLTARTDETDKAVGLSVGPSCALRSRDGRVPTADVAFFLRRGHRWRHLWANCWP